MTGSESKLPQARAGLLLLGAALLLAPTRAGAAAEAEPGAPTTVEITVQVIAASNGSRGVDKRLAQLQKRLKDFNFSSYELLSEHTFKLGLNSEETLPLPDGRSLEVTPRKFERSGMIRVHLHVRAENQTKLVDTEYAIERGGDLVVGGMKHGDGALLLALHHQAAK